MRARPVAWLVVRNLEGEVMARLQLRARRHGCSVEEEAREILRDAVKEQGAPTKPLGSRLRERFAGIGLEEGLPEWRGEPISRGP